MKHDDLLTLCTVHDPVLAEIIRNDLAANGIAAQLSGSNFSAQLPGNPMQEVEVLVKAQDAGKAKKLVEKHLK